MSSRSAKIIMTIFVLGGFAMFCESFIGLYPENTRDTYFYRTCQNSITTLGFLVGFIFLWFNPHILIANGKERGEAFKNGGNTKLLGLSYLGSFLIVAGVIYGFTQ